MSFNFDEVIDRRSTNSVKWQLYGPDVLPLWVADMDFRTPQPIRTALQSAVDHGIFGYEFLTSELREIVASRMEKLYNWKVSPAAIVPTPGVIAGFTAAARTVCSPGEGVLVQPPVYPPFLSVHERTRLVLQQAPLRAIARDYTIRYEVDWDGFRQGINAGGARTGMFLLCNPHNPIGQAFSRSDLERMLHELSGTQTVICSDEIHAELLLGETQHIPIASLEPGNPRRFITLIAPSKTFNIPGLFCAFAVITDEELRQRFEHAVEEMALHVNSLGLIAARAAYSGACDEWLVALRAYLAKNRDFLVDTIRSEFPGIRVTIPDATYLAWLDCRDLVASGRIDGSPHKFFLHKAKVALNEGSEFGFGGEGFVRLNFGCPRSTLEQALEKMKAALA